MAILIAGTVRTSLSVTMRLDGGTSMRGGVYDSQDMLVRLMHITVPANIIVTASVAMVPVTSNLIRTHVAIVNE